jgi:methyltransferase (TIGR00027 family)
VVKTHRGPGERASRQHDGWKITSGIGSTALGMAIARARENARPRRLFSDPFAQIFVDEAIQAGWDAPPSAAPRQLHVVADPQLAAQTTALMNYAACRTVYFDEFFLRANGDGVRQVVVLGAGLDARPWRLPWEPGTVVYEIDQPQVLEFKINTLWARNSDPTCQYRPVAVDLRSDWPQALRDNGFDVSQSSAWSAEGLLSYLAPHARRLLFDRIDDHSAQGSRIAVETASTVTSKAATSRAGRSVTSRTPAANAAVGDTTLRDIRALWFPDRGDNFAGWLASRGWRVTSIEAYDLMARCGRAPVAGVERAIPRSAFVDGIHFD